jgi:NADPH2:quinone reductase
MSIPLLTGIGRERQGEILQEVAKLVDEGILKPLINGQRFLFDEVNEAHGLFEAKRYTGKIVLTP